MAENENIAQFVITRSDWYADMEYHSFNKLYFLADTNEIYRGDVPFGTGVAFFDELPKVGAVGKLYINNDTLIGYVWRNGGWVKVLDQYTVVDEITDEVALDSLVSVAALKKFIRTSISDMTYNVNDYSLEYNQGGLPKRVVIEGLLADAKYDIVTSKIVFKDVKGRDAISVKIPKDNFPVKGYYDETTQCIILQMRSDSENEEPYELRIPAKDLVDVRISEVEGNLLKQYEDGYGVLIDITGKMDKVPEGLDGRILTANQDGNANAINMFVGGAHFSLIDLGDGRFQADPNTLATESGVWHIIKDINSALERLNKYTITHIVNKESPSEYKYISEVALVDIYNELQDNVARLDEDVRVITNAGNTNAESIQNALQDISDLRNKIQLINTKIDDEIMGAVNSVPDILNNIEDIRDNILANSTSISNLFTITSNLNARINDLSLRLDQSNSKHAEDMETLNNTIKGINDTIKVIYQDMSTMQDHFDNQISDVHDRITDVINDIGEFMDKTAFQYYM